MGASRTCCCTCEASYVAVLVISDDGEYELELTCVGPVCGVASERAIEDEKRRAL